MAMQSPAVSSDVLELAALLRPTWPVFDAELHASGVPLCEGETETETEKTEAEKTSEKTTEDTSEEAKTEAEETETETTDKTDHSDRPNWESQSRKHEREAKKARKRADDLAKQLKEREDEDKSEQEKAVDKAREEGKTEALTAAEKDRRQDRLEVAVARAAGKPIKVGEGEDAKTLKFADPEDAQIYLDRAISNGDLDVEDIFDDKGKVKAEAVTGFLQELLDERPRLAIDTEEKPKPKGGADGGKGSDAGDKPDMNDLLRRKN